MNTARVRRARAERRKGVTRAARGGREQVSPQRRRTNAKSETSRGCDDAEVRDAQWLVETPTYPMDQGYFPHSAPRRPDPRSYSTQQDQLFPFFRPWLAPMGGRTLKNLWFGISKDIGGRGKGSHRRDDIQCVEDTGGGCTVKVRLPHARHHPRISNCITSSEAEARLTIPGLSNPGSWPA